MTGQVTWCLVEGGQQAHGGRKRENTSQRHSHNQGLSSRMGLLERRRWWRIDRTNRSAVHQQNTQHSHAPVWRTSTRAMAEWSTLSRVMLLVLLMPCTHASLCLNHDTSFALLTQPHHMAARQEQATPHQDCQSGVRQVLARAGQGGADCWEAAHHGLELVAVSHALHRRMGWCRHLRPVAALGRAVRVRALHKHPSKLQTEQTRTTYALRLHVVCVTARPHPPHPTPCCCRCSCCCRPLPASQPDAAQLPSLT